MVPSISSSANHPTVVIYQLCKGALRPAEAGAMVRGSHQISSAAMIGVSPKSTKAGLNE